MADESKSKRFAEFYEAFGVSDDEDDIFVGFLCEDLGLRPYRGLNGEDKAKRDLIETKSRFGRHLVQRLSIDKAKRTRKRSEHKSKSSDGRKSDESEVHRFWNSLVARTYPRAHDLFDWGPPKKIIHTRKRMRVCHIDFLLGYCITVDLNRFFSPVGKRQSGSKEIIVRQRADEEKRQEEERDSETVNVVKTGKKIDPWVFFPND